MSAAVVSGRADGSGEWWERAACKGLDTDRFFPVRGESAAEAEAVCAACPVTQDCLWFALGESADAPRQQKFGVWGGTSERARQRLRRERRKAVTQ
ncbi:MAG: WhiB family transcriptional regulator [Actinomycetota bacterium]